MKLLRTLILLLTLSPALLAAAKQNVVLFVCDDLGFQLGCYGDKIARTPNIDRLASEGARFTRAFCTTASCSPSRSVILTGLHAHTNGQLGLEHSVHHFESFGGVKSLPVLLAAGGYRTARIGKFHVAPEEVYHFEQVLAPGQGGPRNGVTMADVCAEFFAAKDERPFFLYFCTTDPHRSTVDAAHPLKADAFGNGPAYLGVTEQVFDPKEVPVPSWLPDSPSSRAELANYYQAIARVDAGLGQLVKTLKDSGHYDDTLIVFTSDNGPPFPGAKTTLYEPGTNLPLIVRAPEMAHRGGVSDAMISWVDFTPTILDFCGVKVPDQAPLIPKPRPGKPQPYPFHGRSFVGVWDDPHPPGWQGPIYGSHSFHEITMYYPMREIRTERYKLLLNIAHELSFPFASDLYEGATWQSTLKSSAAKYGLRSVDAYLHRPRYELYDLEKDPAELSNVGTDPAYKATFDELSAKLKTFQQTTRDPWLLKYEHE